MVLGFFLVFLGGVGGGGVLPFLVYCYVKFVLVNWNWMIRGIALMTLHQANSHGRTHQPETF